MEDVGVTMGTTTLLLVVEDHSTRERHKDSECVVEIVWNGWFSVLWYQHKIRKFCCWYFNWILQSMGSSFSLMTTQVFSWNVGRVFLIGWYQELCFLLCLLSCTGTFVNIFVFPLATIAHFNCHVHVLVDTISLLKYPPGEGKERHKASFWRVSVFLYQECGCHLISLVPRP